MQNNPHLTKEELLQYFFSKDQNHDGYLDFYELKSLYRELCTKKKIYCDDAFVEKFIKNVDKNRDGKNFIYFRRIKRFC